MAKTAVKCSKMFDSTTGTVLHDQVIFVEDNKIADVVPASQAGSLEGYSSSI